MNEFFGNPAVQAGIAPFAAALAIGMPLRHTRMLVLAMAAGLLAVVWLTMGLSFESLTSVRKLVLAGFGAVVLVLALDAMPLRGSVARMLLAAAAAGAAVWVALRVLQQKEPSTALAAGAGAALYLAALVEGTQRATAGAPLRCASLALVLGLGTGALAVLGASAQLAQLAIAVGAAGGAVILALLAARQVPASALLAVPAVVVAGLASLLAVFTGVLPWFCLLPVLAVPWAVWLVPQAPQRPPFWTCAYTGAAAAVPMSIAVALAWASAASST